jgi:hypothetical protein
MKWLPSLHISTFQDFDDLISWQRVLSNDVSSVILSVSFSRFLQFHHELKHHQFFEDVFDELSLFDE